MAQSITPVAGFLATPARLAWRPLAELALVVAAVALLLPRFEPLAVEADGRDARFADATIVVGAWPDAALPETCTSHASIAEAAVRDRLCARSAPAQAAPNVDRVPATLIAAASRVRRAFLAPLDEAEARLASLRASRDAEATEIEPTDAVQAAEAEIRPYVARYAIDRKSEGPRPLACALDAVRAIHERGAPHALPPALRDAARANAVVLLAAALDGHPAVPALARTATLPTAVASCGALDPADALAATATIVADAREAPRRAAKNAAMRDLLRDAGAQWAGAAAIGFVLLQLSRRRITPALGAGLALVAWAIAGWIARVPWPLATEEGFTLARAGWPPLALPLDRPLDAVKVLAAAAPSLAPARFVLIMFGIGVLLMMLAPVLRSTVRPAPQQPGSALAYPGLVLATGIGWLVLLDLSANAHAGNRYLALYHQGHLWLAMTLFAVVAFLRQPIARMLASLLSFVDGLAQRLVRAVGAVRAWLLLAALALAMTVTLALMLANLRQLTSELGRAWLIVGAAWFFFLRGTPLTERIAQRGTTLGSLVRYVGPLAFVVLVLVAAMVVTRDMGPLLIAGYGAGAFVAASLAMWLHQRTGATVTAYGLAVVLFAAWIAATTAALFRVGALDEVTAARLENAAAPLASANDHLALVGWFQRAAPPGGFGPGAVPWCGYGASGSCAGVPAQIQSDYTFTALVGEFGWSAAWLVTLGCVAWLCAVIRRHAAATHGEPRLVRTGTRLVLDAQAFASWLVVAWVVLALCQLAVTVAGNLAVIPLTGVTFPFVSFGMTSLVTNVAMLALAVNVDAPGER